MKNKLCDIKRVSKALAKVFFESEQSHIVMQEARQIIAAALIDLDENGQKDLRKELSNADGSSIDDLQRTIQQYASKRAEEIRMTRSQISTPANSTNGNSAL